jgi:hypothetical protein
MNEAEMPRDGVAVEDTTALVLAKEAFDRLSSYVDGHQGYEDKWILNDAYDALYRAFQGPTFVDEDTERAEVAAWEQRWSAYRNEPRQAEERFTPGWTESELPKVRRHR